MSTRGWWDYFVDGALILLAATAVTVFALSYFRPRTPSNRPVDFRSLEQGLIGRKLEAPVDSPRRPSLVLVFTSTCPVCELTAPVWRQISADSAHRTQVVMTTPESRDVGESWMQRHELRGDTLVANTSVSHWGVAGVPVTFVTDDRSVVRHVRIGILNPSDAVELRSALERLSLSHASSVSSP